MQSSRGRTVGPRSGSTGHVHRIRGVCTVRTPASANPAVAPPPSVQRPTQALEFTLLQSVGLERS